MANFLKGIIIGLGGIAPGLSGSVLLVIFGLYQKAISSVSDIIKDFLAIIGLNKKITRKEAWKDFLEKLKFLIPLALGMAVGVVLFSKLVDFLLENYEMYTRFAFLGLILGTIPLFYREVKKEGFHKKYYAFMAVAVVIGICIFYLGGDFFQKVTDPSLLQSVILGVAVAGSSIVPGVDSAAILTALGLYEVHYKAIASLNFEILIPEVIGLVIGVVLISVGINWLMGKCYTATFSVIFGLFLTIIPKVVAEGCHIAANAETVISFVILVVSFIASLLFSNLEKLKEKAQE